MNCYIDNHNPKQKSYQEVTEYIIRKRKTNRREIEAETGYSWGTVSSVVSLLLDSGLVEEIDGESNPHGRKARWLVPNGKKFAAIGIDLNSDVFTLTALGIDGSLLFEDKRKFEKKTMSEFNLLFYSMLDEAISKTEKERKIVSIGVSCQGAICDDHSIFTNFSFVEDWKATDIKKELENRYKIFTFVEHDTHCVAEDYVTDNKPNGDNFLIVRVVSGIGFSIYSHGKFFERIAPVDFGHTVVEHVNGEPCHCGATGCLEAYSSSTGIIRRSGAKTFEEIKRNPSKFESYLNDAGYYLGLALVNARRLFDFRTIVLTGDVIEADAKIIDSIKRFFDERNRNLMEEVKIVFLPGLSASSGAAKLSIVERFASNNLLNAE
ncbi:MAG: ROK family protein [Bacilli bacterium]|nr:ROK family protein [Bacilli bacterium]